jgi:tetratricopeptide (TPR) repeat protein
MTSNRPDPDASAADRAQTFVDWTRVNSTALTAGAVILVVAAVVFWFYGRSRAITAGNAEKALMTAKQSMAAGNLPLAQTDLQNVYARYGSTSAGVEAAMILAQLDYDSGKYQDGVTLLQKASSSSAAQPVTSTLRSLEGDGYGQMGKLEDAAKQYDAAAAATSYQDDRAYQRAKAARAYQTAGDTAKARQIWSDMLKDPTASSMAPEARVRLGELTVRPAML